MAVLERTITINAPVEKVFNFLIKPESWKEIYPKITEIRDIQSLPNGGYRFSYRFNMFAGMRCEVDTENTDVVTNQLIGYKNTCGIKGKKSVELNETISFSPEDGKTKLTYKAEYKVPVPVVGVLIESVLMKINERMIRTCLNNLKAKME
jgi:carbon monoxide dehydrogenase subunit G